MVATSDKERSVLLKNLLLIFFERKDNLMGCKKFGQKVAQNTEETASNCPVCACLMGCGTQVAFPGPV